MDVRCEDFPKFGQYQRAYVRKHLISNVKHDEQHQCVSFNIEIDHEFFRRQLLPFYDLAFAFYDYHIMANALPASPILQSLFEKSTSATETVGAAEYRGEWQLFKLTASHPTYCELKYKFTKNKRYQLSEYGMEFYHRKGGERVARSYSKLVHFTAADLKRITQKRDAKKAKWKTLYTEPTDDTFEFALPHLVGKSNEKLVFLSNLKEDRINGGAIYCDGLNTMDKNFTFHPFHSGSGDHINSGGVYDILLQFASLLVRNALKFPKLKHKILAIYGDKFDMNSTVTVGHYEIDFKQRLELGVEYRVKLIQFECTKNEKYPFILTATVQLWQHDVKTTNAKFKIYPVFSRCRL